MSVSPSTTRLTLTPKPLEFPTPPTHYFKGDRVEYRVSYASAPSKPKALRGTVVEDAPLSLQTGVKVLWDDGDERVVPCFEAKRLDLLDRMAEL